MTFQLQSIFVSQIFSNNIQSYFNQNQGVLKIPLRIIRLLSFIIWSFPIPRERSDDLNGRHLDIWVILLLCMVKERVWNIGYVCSAPPDLYLLAAAFPLKDTTTWLARVQTRWTSCLCSTVISKLQTGQNKETD